MREKGRPEPPRVELIGEPVRRRDGGEVSTHKTTYPDGRVTYSVVANSGGRIGGASEYSRKELEELGEGSADQGLRKVSRAALTAPPDEVSVGAPRLLWRRLKK